VIQYWLFNGLAELAEQRSRIRITAPQIARAAVRADKTNYKQWAEIKLLFRIRMLRRSFSVSILFLSCLALAQAFATELIPCFTPDEDCTLLIVDQINGAKSTVLVQAYGFTSNQIIQALGRAKERGVDVKIILDKSNEQKRYTSATYLTNHGIKILIDDTVVIAHNKVIVIDGKDVITGSFNFTRAAHKKTQRMCY